MDSFPHRADHCEALAELLHALDHRGFDSVFVEVAIRDESGHVLGTITEANAGGYAFEPIKRSA